LNLPAGRLELLANSDNQLRIDGKNEGFVGDLRPEGGNITGMF
jgi:hypothetical protein